ncbi:MAG: hypothetical protein WD266_04135 [Balneolales bacterium]
MRNIFLVTALIFLSPDPGLLAQAGDENRRPNFIVIFTDDLGYGDVGRQRIGPHPDPSP